ncbi:calmodulin-binding transcription activator 3-like isoform X1 [Zingiber officinale]|uniref:calmodulin-binding transcription activator 3-like isoform X1 n=1 Tax=Zingiber officinale TaxID=94328 RepID=UPI001C4A79CB|nr:calmodulin-binding transcription activator 3-like isoform X1 [Zingiber officinale]
MADARRFSLTPQLDIQQILIEAQHRWLRPAEICEILQNYKKFNIAPESPNKPPSGSLFLFDRKVLRYFRKDGHNWRKKKDGKTVKEAHERLKAGSVDVLHCYYAHGEENESFQRRSYWMLEEDLMHIVLVHYLEVKGHRPSSSRIRDEVLQVNHIDSPASSNSFTNHSQLPSQVTDVESPNSVYNLEYEDAESADNPASSRHHTFSAVQQYDSGKMKGQLLDPFDLDPSIYSQGDLQGQYTESASQFYSSMPENVNKDLDGTGFESAFIGSKTQFDQASWNEVLQHATAQMPSDHNNFQATVDGELYADNVNFRLDVCSALKKSARKISDDDTDSAVTIENDASVGESCHHSYILKQLSLDLSSLQGEGLKKYDSFSRWMSKELGEVEDTHIKASPVEYWSTVGSDIVVGDSDITNQGSADAYIMSLSLSQDQLFSIIDFAPNWVHAGMETKVLITGKFLKNNDIEKINWSCMFGEIEVPAKIVGDGILSCNAPLHKCGRVPFYVTCSNRLACSEVREFEFRESDGHHMEEADAHIHNSNEMFLHLRLSKLLSLGPLDYQTFDMNILGDFQVDNQISSLKSESEWSNLIKLSEGNGFSAENVEEQLLETSLQERLHIWLMNKVAEDGKGPNIWDEEGQGVLHLAAALGYDWALEPTVSGGVNINFRDAHGWTALHWAAFSGRERTVGALIAMGASPGLLTDPTPEYPSGRTPADLASANGHKGIAGFLAESSLTSHLSALTIEPKSNEISNLGTLAGSRVEEPSFLEVPDGDMQAGLSLKDSLTAVRNASQAAARIHQAFRVYSFHRRKLAESGNDKSGMFDERALSRVSIKSQKPGQSDMPLHAAASRIQNKFRGWKGRREFLIFRQRVVKIQAHVRGHQVRKRIKSIVWSVGIVEKVILRWRRKGSGLRGFRSESPMESTSIQCQPAKEDDYDFLQEGRKQTEVRMQRALARVKSMVQYPEAREQYQRLITVVTELQESKAMQENMMNESEAVAEDFMVELEEFWDGDTLLPNA